MTRRTEARMAFVAAQRAPHLAALTEPETRRRVRALVNDGWSEIQVAEFMRLDVQLVRRWLSEKA